ncbi:MAG: hypothetical protein GDA40_12535 [Rhodobacteraceae bacterium]|nr:hypothetical protein [Paracoccaceae bacterium]
MDPIDWQNRRRLHPAQHIIDRTATLLRKRRSGIYDAREPLGLLTHHRVHNQAVWAFTRALLSALREGHVDLWQATR